MDRRALWNRIEHRLGSFPRWRERVKCLGQVERVGERSAGRTWSDDEVFQALLMAVLSSNTDWSKVEGVQAELAELFSGFSLASYAELSSTEIGHRFVPWFEERKAGSMTLERDLEHLIGAARILQHYSGRHGSAEGYFTSLLQRCDGDSKQAALRLGSHGADKLPSLGVALAAEALKNLGFDVAKPDRHIMRAVGSFGLVRFKRWPKGEGGRNGRAAPASTSREQLLAVMSAVEQTAKAAGESVVLVDNAIWLLCAKSGLYLTNRQLAELAVQGERPEGRLEGLGVLIRSWMDDEDAGEQRETIEHLVRTLDEDRLSGRKLFPEELKGKTW